MIDGYPGLYRDLLTYLRERIKEVLTGASATVVVRVFGEDLDLLREYAEDVAAEIDDVPGVADLTVQAQVFVPQSDVHFRPDAGRRFGVSLREVQQTVGTVIKAQKVGEFYEDRRSSTSSSGATPRCGGTRRRSAGSWSTHRPAVRCPFETSPT